MAEAILEIVLKNLNSLIQNELPLFFGFDQDMRRLASLVTTIKATLEDAEEKQFTDKAIKDWLRKLKDAAYILDDILDECNYEALRLEYQGVNCGTLNKVLSSCLSSFHPKHGGFCYKTAKKMKRVSERLDEIAQERSKFHLTERHPERRSGVIDWRKTTQFIHEPQVYGRKNDTEQIVDFLIGEASRDEELSVYPIIGLGGLGKTTLAQVIFNHDSIVKHFEKRMWVCVSEDFNLERMTKAIIEEATGASCEKLELQPLQRKLQDTLQGQRYLLVLDDVWNYGNWEENWQKLKSVLCCGAKGASILVTTRLYPVARIMGGKKSHELSELSDDDCWELFKCRAFEPNEVEQVELVDIGKEIVKKCRGVPLAAKALGGLLRFKRRSVEVWHNVKESNLLEVSQVAHNEKSIKDVLRLSYLNLPTKLRQCFAYCAIFPKDEQIEKKYLIDLWMANGFISYNERLDYDDVGDDVWNELYLRSFFQNVETDRSGKVTRFKMHDLVHDLAQLVAEEVCCMTNENDIANLSERIYHLSVHTKEAINPIELHPNQSLRTCIWISGITLSLVLKCYSLRVLSCMVKQELPSEIGSLKHLRYLDISWSKFKTLPESLCKLWWLQVLILDCCPFLKKLPNSLLRLKALQKLSLRVCRSLTSLPPRIGKLTSLRFLTMFFVGKEEGFHIAELGPLKLKGDLEIKHLERVKSEMDAKEANMSSKKLNRLWLSWDSNEESELQENVEQIFEVLQPDIQRLECLYVKGYKGAHFPQWISCSSLKALHIRECRTFNVSAGFECLEYLSISRCRDVEGLHEALPHMTALKKLELRDLPNLESLPDCFGNLPLLHELSIGECYKLTCLPTSLSLSNIEILNVWRCSDELKKRCEKESGEDWPKIAHIPKIQNSQF